MIEDQQFGVGQTLGELAQILFQHERLTRTGVGLLLGAEFQIRRLRSGVDLASAGHCLIAGNAGLQLRLIGRFGCRTALA